MGVDFVWVKTSEKKFFLKLTMLPLQNDIKRNSSLEAFMKDNINERYKVYVKKPGSMKRSLENFNKITEKNYSVFREVVEDHSDIGKAAIVIMATNLASHIMKAANDESKPKARRIYEIAGIIAPMYEMFYDRLTRETIEGLEGEIEWRSA